MHRGRDHPHGREGRGRAAHRRRRLERVHDHDRQPAHGGVRDRRARRRPSDGFTYTPGSTTGATTANPSVTGQRLRWTGPFTLPAGGRLTLHFGVTVADEPGTYLNEASAESDDVSITPTGPTAPIVVTPALSVGDASVTEGNTGTTDATFTVTLSGPSTEPVTVDYATEDVTATGAFATAAAPTTGFVQRDGAALTLGGVPYHFSGLNVYNLNSDGLCAYEMSGAVLEDSLTAIAGSRTQRRPGVVLPGPGDHGRRPRLDRIRPVADSAGGARAEGDRHPRQPVGGLRPGLRLQERRLVHDGVHDGRSGRHGLVPRLGRRGRRALQRQPGGPGLRAPERARGEALDRRRLLAGRGGDAAGLHGRRHRLDSFARREPSDLERCDRRRPVRRPGERLSDPARAGDDRSLFRPRLHRRGTDARRRVQRAPGAARPVRGDRQAARRRRGRGQADRRRRHARRPRSRDPGQAAPPGPRRRRRLARLGVDQGRLDARQLRHRAGRPDARRALRLRRLRARSRHRHVRTGRDGQDGDCEGTRRSPRRARRDLPRRAGRRRRSLGRGRHRRGHDRRRRRSTGVVGERRLGVGGRLGHDSGDVRGLPLDRKRPHGDGRFRHRRRDRDVRRRLPERGRHPHVRARPGEQDGHGARQRRRDGRAE